MTRILAIVLLLLSVPAFAQVYTNKDPATGQWHARQIFVSPGTRHAVEITKALLERQYTPPPVMGHGPTVTFSGYDPEWPFSNSVRLPVVTRTEPFFINGIPVTRPPFLAPLGWTSIAIGDRPEPGHRPR